MSDQGFNPVEAMDRDGEEIQRLRARTAELEMALRVAEGALSGGPFHLPRIETRAEEDALALARAALERAMSRKERIILTLETAIGILTPQEGYERTEMDWSNFAASARAMLTGLIAEMNEAKP